MKRRNKIFFAVIILILIAIAYFGFRNLNYLQSFSEKNIGKYGYSAVFVLSILADIIDQPIGPETIGSIGIVLGLNLFLVFILAVAGSWIANLANYYIGKKYFSKRIVESCSTGEYYNYCRIFHKYGKWSLLFSALFFPYILFTWIAGAFGLKFKNFFIYGMLARALRIALVLGVIKIVFKI